MTTARDRLRKYLREAVLISAEHRSYPPELVSSMQRRDEALVLDTSSVGIWRIVVGGIDYQHPAAAARDLVAELHAAGCPISAGYELARGNASRVEASAVPALLSTMGNSRWHGGLPIDPDLTTDPGELVPAGDDGGTLIWYSDRTRGRGGHRLTDAEWYLLRDGVVTATVGRELVRFEIATGRMTWQALTTALTGVAGAESLAGRALRRVMVVLGRESTTGTPHCAESLADAIRYLAGHADAGTRYLDAVKRHHTTRWPWVDMPVASGRDGLYGVDAALDSLNLSPKMQTELRNARLPFSATNPPYLFNVDARTARALVARGATTPDGGLTLYLSWELTMAAVALADRYGEDADRWRGYVTAMRPGAEVPAGYSVDYDAMALWGVRRGLLVGAFEERAAWGGSKKARTFVATRRTVRGEA